MTVEIAVQTNSMILQKQLVTAGHGWTILPGAGVAADVARGALSAAPLTDPEVLRSIAIGTPRAGPVSPAARIVADELIRQIHVAAGQSEWPFAELL